MQEQEAAALIAETPALYAAVEPALKGIRVRRSKRIPLAKRCAAYLWADGSFESLHELPFGGEDDWKIVERTSRRWLKRCQNAGILPEPTFGNPIVWFILQYVFLPYLGRLIQIHLFGPA